MVTSIYLFSWVDTFATFCTHLRLICLAIRALPRFSARTQIFAKAPFFPLIWSLKLLLTKVLVLEIGLLLEIIHFAFEFFFLLLFVFDF